MTAPTPTRTQRHVLALAAKGPGTNDEDRLRALLSELGDAVRVTFVPFDRAKKLAAGIDLLRRLLREKPDLMVLEGTGLAPGLACLAGRLLGGVRYVVSSGDAVGPFVAAIRPAAGPLFCWYERRLCRHAAGFIGWSPYLVGRAISYGAPAGVTAAGWSPTAAASPDARRRVRAALGIDESTTVFGIAGALVWNKRYGYCYGAELVRAAAEVLPGRDVAVVIVGDGSGLSHLRALAQSLPAGRVHFVGRVPGDEVADYLAAFDVASLPQSADAVGQLRYTTKLSEYVAAGVPVVTGRLPLAYDLGTEWAWRLAGGHPWSPAYVEAMARLMNGVMPADIAARRVALAGVPDVFNRAAQVRAVTAFISDILGVDQSSAGADRPRPVAAPAVASPVPQPCRE